MFEKEIAALIEAFGERQRLFDKDRQADAKVFRDGQLELWHKVLGWIASNVHPSDNHFHTSLEEIKNAIADNKDNIFKLKSVSDKLQVSGKLPLLNQESLNKSEALSSEENHTYMLLAALIIEAGGVLQNLEFKPKNEGTKTSKLSLNPLMTPQVIQYMCLYASQRHVSKQPDLKAIADLRTQIETYFLDIKRRDVTCMGDWETFQKQKEEELAKLRESLEEKIALKAAVKVWSDKISGHRTTFHRSFGSLVVVTVLLLVAVFCWRHEISTFLHSLAPEGGDLRYGFLVLTLIPVLAIGWLLRIGGKVATQALTLKADAEQRSAMVSTYLSLIADPNAGVDKSDRSIVLNALFRPLPGESEDISPPSFVELLKDRPKKE